ncbi:Outer membrane efflux protein [Candidatus Sulfopaludibacter sp. SbA6]|nr:Outer membrane efflux protein [Candidatus Sulfopaludibacter sp. SbA6]
MRCIIRYVCVSLLLAGGAAAQTALTWQQVEDKFRAANPNLRAGQLNIQESKAGEITAYLRPNPNFTMTLDQLQPFNGNPYRPFGLALPLVAFDYLHERQHKRELRLESAQQGTAIAESQQQDLERTLLFNLRTAFVQTLEAKALLANAKENLNYFDKELAINRARFRSGDIARVDLDRIALQRVQYESDFQTALVNARTAKITLLMLLNERTPVDQFDVTGPFEFKELIPALDDFHTMALAARPDLQAALLAVEKAGTDHRLAVANGSTDPTFSVDFGRNPPIPVYMGVSISIPLRLFDRNQGEKARTRIDIAHAERQKEAAQAQVFSDVDSAYFTLLSSVSLLRPYTAADGYLETARRIRDTMSFSYQRGQAALVDYLDAQRDYRATEVAYINLVGAYLTAAGQLNMAVGREAIP